MVGSIAGTIPLIILCSAATLNTARSLICFVRLFLLSLLLFQCRLCLLISCYCTGLGRSSLHLKYSMYRMDPSVVRGYSCIKYLLSCISIGFGRPVTASTPCVSYAGLLIFRDISYLSTFRAASRPSSYTIHIVFVIFMTAFGIDTGPRALAQRHRFSATSL